MKYLLFFCLFIAFGANAQSIQPITKPFETGELPEGVDQLVLEEILGDNRLAVPHQIWSAIYTPDGKYIVVGGYSYAACFEQTTGKRIWQHFFNYGDGFRMRPVRGLAAHEKNNRLLIGNDDGQIFLFNYKTGKLLKTLEDDFHWVMGLAISPDGRFGAGGDLHGKYKMWDLETGKAIDLPNIQCSRTETVAFSSDGRYLAVGAANALNIIDWDNGTFESYKTPSTVQSVLFINNDTEVLVSGWTGFIKRIHLESKKELWATSRSDWIINLQALPDGLTALAISSFYMLKIDWENEEIITYHDLPVRTALDLHPNKKTILIVGQFAHRVEQFDLASQQTFAPNPFYSGVPMRMAFSPNGKYLAAAPYFRADKAIFWKTDTWETFGKIEGSSLNQFEKFQFSDHSDFFFATRTQNNSRTPRSQLPTVFKIPSLEPHFSDNVGSIPRIDNPNRTSYGFRAINLESIYTAHIKKMLPIQTSAYFGKLDTTMNRHLFGGFTIESAYFAGITNDHILYIFDTKTGEKMAGIPLKNYRSLACAIHPEAKKVAVTAWDGLIYIYRWERGR